jgi:glycosyltransferase involved in cell wall biosynthesis
MRLLVVTQAVDLDDPVLGFFHRWLEEFAKKCEMVHVICLKEGRHSLPQNVRVHSLGKEKGRSRLKYIFNFYRYVWTLRREYDSVFVHMNAEYAALAGNLWLMLGKKMVLWRNHRKPGFLTALAVQYAWHVCYTSPDAYVAKFKRAVRMPIGIDTERFRPAAHSAAPNTILFLGRLDEVKRVKEFVAALQELAAQGAQFHASIYGDPTDPASRYAAEVKAAAASLVANGNVTFHPSMPNAETPAIYGAHAVYVNLTPSGSFDKTIGEAMACGAVVVCSNAALKEIIPTALQAGETMESAAKAIRAALELPPAERDKLAAAERTYIEREHSLLLLVKRLAELFR